MTAALRSPSAQKTLTMQNAILLYFVIFSVGLCKLTWVMSRYIEQYIDLHEVLNQMSDWAASFPHEKLPQLLFFCFSVVALFLFWGLYFGLSFNKNKWPVKSPPASWVVTYFVAAALLNLGLVPIAKYLFLDTFAWLFGFFALPGFLYKQKIKTSIAGLETKFYLAPNVIWVMTGLVTMLFIFLFVPFIFKPLQIVNEFMDVPEQTLFANGQAVDNMQYLNQHPIGGLHLYDPRHDQGAVTESVDIAKVKLPWTPTLSHFLNGAGHALFVYDESSQTLSIKGRMPKRAYRELLDIYQNDRDSMQQVKQLFVQANQIENLNKKHIYTPEEQEFIRKNRSEVAQKIKAGWFFFHHSWVLNPILAISLGADASKQVFIYGVGSAVFLQHVLKKMGGISFQNYFAATFAVYPIYFLIFLAVLYRIFKRADFVCIGAILLSTSFFILGYQMILLAPGYNPMRHVFDMLIILLFFRYIQKNTMLSLLMVVLAGWTAIVWSKDFGLFLMLPCLGTVIIKNCVLSRQAYAHFLVAGLGLIIAGILYCLPIHGVNYNFLYMLLGVTMPGTSTIRISIVLFGIGLMYVFFVRSKKVDSDYYWLSLGLFFYFQLQLIYYIWYPSVQHFLVLAPIIIIGGLTLVRLGYDTNKETVTGCRLVLLSSLLFLYLPSLYSFNKEKTDHHRVFEAHIVHNWDFKYARFQTTMEPYVFGETVRLIEKYTPDSAMVLISKYDDILPVLAHRYNALPVVNLALDLISNRDTNRCIQAINLNKPQYVLVDSDIHRDLRGDVVLPHGHWGAITQYDESYGRFMVIKNMRTLFDAIQQDYSLLEQGSLLSVYQRKLGA